MEEMRCPVCGGALEKVLFTQKEEQLVCGTWHETGRVRINVDYLLCESCGHKETVDDDTFAGPWYHI